jgi:SAM-dependent methyltransferase
LSFSAILDLAIADLSRFGRLPRVDKLEILETSHLSEDEFERSYRQLHTLHRFLGNTRALMELLKRQKEEQRRPLKRVLDIGCGRGALLREISSQLGTEGIGFDLHAAPRQSEVLILQGDATRDPLPKADVAICVVMAHHLSPEEIVALIQNVSRSCNRLVLLDLVRHAVPLALFRVFVLPFLCPINQQDGQTSIKRAYTEGEMKGIVEQALAAGKRPVRCWGHTVSAFWTRQIVDIEWEPSSAIGS